MFFYDYSQLFEHWNQVWQYSWLNLLIFSFFDIVVFIICFFLSYCLVRKILRAGGIENKILVLLSTSYIALIAYFQTQLSYNTLVLFIPLVIYLMHLKNVNIYKYKYIEGFLITTSFIGIIASGVLPRIIYKIEDSRWGIESARASFLETKILPLEKILLEEKAKRVFQYNIKKFKLPMKIYETVYLEEIFYKENYLYLIFSMSKQNYDGNWEYMEKDFCKDFIENDFEKKSGLVFVYKYKSKETNKEIRTLFIDEEYCKNILNPKRKNNRINKISLFISLIF